MNVAPLTRTLLRTGYRALVLALLLGGAMRVAAQPGKQRYVVDVCPDGSPVTAEELNDRLRSADTADEAEKILRAAYSQGMLGYLYYHENLDGGGAQGLLFYIPSGTTARTGMRTLGTRDVYLGPLRDETELHALFTDSLAVVGELQLTLGTAFDPAVAEGYFLYWARPHDDAFRIVELPLREGSLRIGRELFADLEGDHVEVALYNTARPGELLGHGLLHFLPTLVERNLRAMICQVTTNAPGITLAQQRSECVRMASELYGRMHPANAVRLMCLD